DHPFDAPVAPRRDSKPRWGDFRDPHLSAMLSGRSPRLLRPLGSDRGHCRTSERRPELTTHKRTLRLHRLEHQPKPKGKRYSLVEGPAGVRAISLYASFE